MVSTEKRKIDLPHTIYFSEDGLSFIINRKDSSKVQSINHFTHLSSKTFQNFAPDLISKMVFEGDIWKIEVPIGSPERSVDRKSLTDLTVTLTRALLSRQFNNSVRKEIFDSKMIRSWNRSNPSRSIDRRSNVSQDILQEFLFKKERQVDVFRYILRQGCKEYKLHHPGMSDNDKERIHKVSEIFINQIDSSLWFFLALGQNTPESRELLSSLKNILIRFLEKEEVGDYLSHLLIELITFLRPEIFREIEKSPMETGQSLKVCFEFPYRGWSGYDDKIKMDIHIADSEMLQKSSVNQMISSRTNDLNRNISISKFYEQASDQTVGLGLHYFSYLKDICQDLDIGFTSNVNQVPGKETRVLMTLRV